MSERNDVLLGFLEFYSNRAEAHASFLIVCIFGLYGLLAIALNPNDFKLLLALPYVILCLSSYHCLQRFNYYSTMAEIIREYLTNYAKYEEIILQEEKGKHITLQDRNLELKVKYRGILRKVVDNRYCRILLGITVLIIPFIVVYIREIFSLLGNFGIYI